MTTKTKLALAAVLMLGIASAAQAGGSKNDADVGGSALSAVPCPALEGYPDCHPNGGAFLTEYSTNSRQASPRRRQIGR